MSCQTPGGRIAGALPSLAGLRSTKPIRMPKRSVDNAAIRSSSATFMSTRMIQEVPGRVVRRRHLREHHEIGVGRLRTGDGRVDLREVPFECANREVELGQCQSLGFPAANRRFSGSHPQANELKRLSRGPFVSSTAGIAIALLEAGNCVEQANRVSRTV
jgi:hypothetical protein